MSNGNLPVVNLTPPPIQSFASKHPGSPEEQAYLRGQDKAKQQTALNAKHAGGGRRRRRRRSRGGAASPSPSPDAPGWVDPDNPSWRDPDDPNPSWIPIPQSHTGVHEAGPETANTASFNGNKALLGGRAQAQFDSHVQFTPTMGQSQSGGRRRRRRSRRRRGGYLPTIDRLDENILSALTDKQKAQAVPFFSKINEIIMTEGAWIDAQKAPGGGRRRKTRRRRRKKSRRRRRRKTRRRTKRKKRNHHRRRRRTKGGGCSSCLLH